MATGWLGWPPAVAWSTPIPELLIAMDARIEWANLTNPFGTRKATRPDPADKQGLAERLRAALRAASNS